MLAGVSRGTGEVGCYDPPRGRYAKDVLMTTETGTHPPPAAPAGPRGAPIPPPDRSPVTRAGEVTQAPDSPAANPDAPVRIEVEMPRDLHDRLTDRDDAPRNRYDMATGRAEYVAEPGAGHERRAADVSEVFVLVKHELHDAGYPGDLHVAGATRLLSDDGAFEPDASLFVNSGNARAARRFEGYLDVRKGHPAPDLVVEIDRSVASSHKLAPYFRMGVREAWTWSRRDGVRIWVVDAGAPTGFHPSDESRVLPLLARDDLARLLASYRPADASRLVREVARRVARALIDRSGEERAAARTRSSHEEGDG